MNMRRFTRLTNAFSKKVENLGYALALHFMYYNFCRIPPLEMDYAISKVQKVQYFKLTHYQLFFIVDLSCRFPYNMHTVCTPFWAG